MSNTFTFTFGSLFAGIGGFDLGLEWAGMVCAWQVENNPFCLKVLAKHWPNVPRYGDIKDVGRWNLETVDLICGGFPCQPHSVAGKRKGAADDRNLWPEMYRVIREIRPTWVLAENVPGIKGTILNSCLSDLESEGYWNYRDRRGRYRIAPLVIPACSFDAPHRRYRVFIVAHTNKGCGTTQEEIRPGRYAAELCSEDVAHAGGTRLERPTRTGDPKQRRKNVQPPGSSQNVAHAQGQRERSIPIRSRRSHKATGNFDGGCTDVPHTNSERLQGGRISGATGDRSQDVEDPQRNGSRTEIVSCQAGGENPARPASRTGGSSRRSAQPDLGVLADGLSPGLAGPWLPEPPVSRTITRVPSLNAKLRGLGNAVLPQKAEWIGRQILAAAGRKSKETNQ